MDVVELKVYSIRVILYKEILCDSVPLFIRFPLSLVFFV